MLGNQSNGNKPVYRNARLFGPNCTVGSNINSNALKNDFNDEDFSEYMKNDVPEMKILPMEYVTKVKSKPKCPPPPPPPPKNKCKCSASTTSCSSENKISKPPTQSKGLKVTINAPESAHDKKSSDKYLVYKRKHSIFGTSKDVLNSKLKYVSDNDKTTVDAAIQDAQKAKEGKRKYLIFDNKKSNSNKFETIQYYFDNKSYEKYVDTKLYGKLNQISNPISNDVIHKVVPEVDEEDNDEEGDDIMNVDSDIDMRGFENSRSWEYRDNAKTESKLKLFESQQYKQQEFNKKIAKSEGSSSTSGASSCSEVSLKRQNCRLKPQQKLIASKSIDDLSSCSNNKSKTNHDVKRINQLFENAKQNQVTIATALKSNIDNKEKYKVHKKVRDDVSTANTNGDYGGDAPLSRENVKKYHRSSTDLNIKSTPTPVSCGFKNCKLPNCPISHHNDGGNSTNNSTSPTSSSVLLINERRSKFDENFIKKFEEMNKKRNNCAVRNNEITVNKTNISVNGKSNIIVNDTKNHYSATTPSCHDHDVFIINADSSVKEKEMHLKTNNQNKTTIKINDSCFVVNHNDSSNSFDVKMNNEKNKNIIELSTQKAISQATNWDKNIRVKNNPQPKFNNKIDVNNKIRSEENSVKIYVIGNDSASSPTPSAGLSSISSTSPDPSSSSSDSSDKDDGYYDASSQGRSSSPEFSEMFKKLRDLCNIKNNKQLQQQMSQMKFGCDGALFWNNSYFDDDETDLLTTVNGSSSNFSNGGNRKQTKSSSSSSSVVYACTKCHTTTEDLLSNYICICRNKVDYITRPLSSEGPLDSGVSESGENFFSPDGQSQTDFESRKLKRGHVLTELLETERIYVNEMRSILTGYRDKLLSEEMQSMVPVGLQGKADVLFGNLHEIYTFHSDVFLKDLENSICMTELVALCFVQRRDVFFRLYSYYCQNIPRSEKLRETLVDTHLFLSECQKKLGHKLPLAAYLLKPVQRITKYQLLLKDLLKFSDTGTCTKELQKALDCMLVVLKCVNDSMHQIAITGFPADLSQQGDLLLQDSFQICSENKKDIRLRIKPQQRHVFLYQKAILFCKQDTKTGHNKSTYQFKHWLKMSQIGLTNTVRGDPKKFELWLEGRSEVHTFQAPTTEIKQKWVEEIGRVLMNQLAQIKDEKKKLYGNANNKSLKQTNSVTCEAPLPTINQRAMSIDSSTDHKAKRITPSITGDDANNTPTWNSTGISASSSEHDNHESNDSDYSNSEDEYTMLDENVPTDKKQNKKIYRRAVKKQCGENFDRNSAEILVEACNLKVQEKIIQYQAMFEERERLNEVTSSNSNLVPCSIVVSNVDEKKADTNNENEQYDKSEEEQKRQSIISDSSADGSRSDVNAEDAKATSEQGSSSGTKFIALADYNAMGNSEISIKEGATIELKKLGCAGWVYVKKLEDETEGWVPCAFLQSTGAVENSFKKSSKHKYRT